LNVRRVVRKNKTENLDREVSLSNERKIQNIVEEELVISCDTTPSEHREKVPGLGWT